MRTARLRCRTKQLSSSYSVVGMVLAIKNLALNTADTEMPAQSSPCQHDPRAPHARMKPELPVQDDQGEREDRMHLRGICIANPLHMALCVCVWGQQNLLRISKRGGYH